MTSSSGRSSSRPTLEQVAALAGVSRGTASRVLSGASNVSENAVEAVRRAAAELHYRPNLAARSLVTGRTGLVGLLVNEPAHKLWTDPFFGELARGAHDRLTEDGVALVLSLATEESERDKLIELATTRLDGVLIVRGGGDEKLVHALVDAGVTAVTAGRPADSLLERVGWVDSENEAGARAAVEHLVERGRRRIGLITGPDDMNVVVDRRSGWREALRAAGLDASAELVEPGAFTIESGAQAMATLLERVPDLDAVFAQNDLMALGAIRQLRVAGKAVPGDVAVVGFDDLMAESSSPTLTTMAQDVQGFGAAMASLLLEQLGGAAPRHEVIPVSLVARESS
ncbi:MAG TPA: LacI family DNA-binding transcriptional regulator [Candidatus Nanopelagicales bacterium]|nr:LacI family DNA-binding transcriptional regulator [Candidatus Nanopelagicales bacterium]